jgi:hypothetical protein
MLDRAAPAGAFKRLRATGSVARHGLRITTTHRFDPDTIAVRWDIRCRRGCAAREIEVQLPTWGEETVIRSGGAPLTAPAPLSAGAALDLGGRYAVAPLRVPAGAVMLPRPTAPQRTVPHPGPTLAIRLPPRRATTLAVLITPAT